MTGIENAKDASSNLSLDPNELLTAEFQYIAQTAFQANEDRARVSSFFMVTLGSLVAALFSVQLDTLGNPANINRGFVFLFWAVSFFGLLTLLQLVRLRQAWRESAVAMDQIKAFYIKHYLDLPLNDALRWQVATLPPLYNPWSIGYMQMMQVAILSGVTFGTAILFLGLDSSGEANWGLAVPLGFLFAGLEVFLYWYLLRPKSQV